MPSPISTAEKLCLSCGLCCNGVIFADVQLQRADDESKLIAGGITLALKAKKNCFTQPCAALSGGSCTVYADRPTYCRDFECALLKSVLAEKTEFNAARRIVKVAQQRSDKVRQLLRKSGNTDETMALSKRFQKVRKQMESGQFERESAETFADLCMAVQDLNVLLADAFYPGRD